MARAGLKHWMLHNDQLAHELDDTLKLSPDYDPVRDVDPALTFHAPLLTGPDSIAGAIRAIVERNSEGTYQAPRGAFLLSALDDESRHEYTADDEPLGVLMESATTNKCINYNADASLENMRTDDIDNGVLSVVSDDAALKAAGLDRVVGKVYSLDNSAGQRDSFVEAFGETDNLNPHSYGIYMRALTGGGAVGIRFDQSDRIDTASPDYVHLSADGITPDHHNNRLSVRADRGSIVYFTLNHLEESPVDSSVIVTPGAAASRAVDQLSWPLAGKLTPILNQSEGMAALLWQPGYDEGILPANTQRALVTFHVGNISLMWLNTDNFPYSVGVGDGTSTIEIAFAEPIEAGKEYLILVTWGGGGNKQIGIKADGVTRWSSPSAYDGAFVEEGFMRIYNQPYAPEHYKHLYLWNVDRGVDWLERFFEGVAN